MLFLLFCFFVEGVLCLSKLGILGEGIEVPRAKVDEFGCRTDTSINAIAPNSFLSKPNRSIPQMSSQQWRQMPIGAEPAPDDNKGVHFRVWAPRRKTVDVVLHDASRDLFIPLAYEGNGYFSALVKQASVGSLYKFRLDHGDSFPDPASRFQPEGVHGWSQVVDSTRFKWTDSDWNGPSKIGNVIYEMHIGTFTKEGTWKAAEKELDSLAELGITVLEVMPIAEFPGAFGWSYDGAYWYAPTRLYGEPDDFRKFVDRAHKLGLAVILDVVYNHFGPDGCYLKEFSKDYFSTKHKSEWGDSPNFDGENCKPARELVVSNVAYWIREFHLDGLRIDVTQSMVDDSDLHILQEMGEAARKAAGKRSTLIVNENEPNNAQLVRPLEQNGMGLDMIWNDDWHHSAKCAATGQDEAYFTDYKGDRKSLCQQPSMGFFTRDNIIAGKLKGEELPHGTSSIGSLFIFSKITIKLPTRGSEIGCSKKRIQPNGVHLLLFFYWDRKRQCFFRVRNGVRVLRLSTLLITIRNSPSSYARDVSTLWPSLPTWL